MLYCTVAQASLKFSILHKFCCLFVFINVIHHVAQNFFVAHFSLIVVVLSVCNSAQREAW